MAVLAQVFTGTHDQALARADALDADAQPTPARHVDLGVTPFDLDELAQIAARVVHFGSGDTEPAEIDLDHENLYRLPEFWCQVLVELGASEDPEAIDDVAGAWADTDEMAGSGDLAPLVRRCVDLATLAQEEGDDVFLWVNTR
jgi:hypothetical protein